MVGGGVGIEPVSLNLKKELAQIRKGARGPETSSSWRSPMNSVRSFNKHHCVHHYKNDHDDGSAILDSSVQFLQTPLHIESSSNGGCDKFVSRGNVKVKEKGRKVLLYTRSSKSASEKDGGPENEDDEEAYSSHEESADLECSNHERKLVGNHSKSYAYLSDGYDSPIFKHKETSRVPSIRHTIKKSKRSKHSINSLLRSNDKLQKQIPLSRCCVKNMVENFIDAGVKRDGLVSLVYHSDDTEHECCSSLACSSMKQFHQKEEDSASQSTPALSTSSYNDYAFKDSSAIMPHNPTMEDDVVHEIGAVPDERLLNLLESAMTSNATETVKRARELMNSGHDPVVLTSRMATLVVDIIAGTFLNVDSKNNGSFFAGRILSKRELEALKHVLTILSKSEKHLRVSTERSTWFMATLLQLSPDPSLVQANSGSSSRQSFKTTEEDQIKMFRGSSAQKPRIDEQFAPEKSGSELLFSISADQNITRKDEPMSVVDAASGDSNANQLVNGEALVLSHYDCGNRKTALRYMNSKVLADIWVLCIKECHSETLRELLSSHGKLVCISEVKGGFVAYVSFQDSAIKTRAEGFLSSIANLFKIVLRHNVEVEIILLPDSLSQTQIKKYIFTSPKNNLACSRRIESNPGLNLDSLKLEELIYSECKVNQTRQFESVKGNDKSITSRESKPLVPMQRIESILRDQRLESTLERGISGSMVHSKAKRNHSLTQYGLSHQNHSKPMDSENLQSQHWQDEFSYDITASKMNDEKASEEDRTIKMIGGHPIASSFLHNTSFGSNISKENIAFKSGPRNAGLRGLWCWNSSQPLRLGKATRAHRMRRFSWSGVCARWRTDRAQ